MDSGKRFSRDNDFGEMGFSEGLLDFLATMNVDRLEDLVPLVAQNEDLLRSRDGFKEEFLTELRNNNEFKRLLKF